MARKSWLFWIIHILYISITFGRIRKNWNCGDATVCELNDHFKERFVGVVSKQEHFVEVEDEVRELSVKIDQLMNNPIGVTAEVEVGETLNQRLGYLEKNITYETNVRGRIQSNLTVLREEIQNLSSSVILMSKDTGLKDLEEDVRNSQNELDVKVKDVKEQLRVVNETLCHSISELNSTLIQLQSSAFVEVATDDSINPEEIDTDDDHLQKRIEDLENDLENDLARLNKESSVLNQRINDTIKTMQTQNQNLTQKISKINQTQTEEIGKLKQQMQSLTSTQQDLINQIKYLNATLQQQISTQPTSADRQDTSCKLNIPTENSIVLKLNGQDVIRGSSQVKDGQSVTYECSDKKYKLEGVAERTCSDGLWSEMQPHCVTVISGNGVLFGTESNPCPEVEGNFRDEHDCTKFYQCSEGHAPLTLPCEGGTFFDTSTSKCEWKKPDNCP